MLRRLAAASLIVLLAASPASADDLFEIDDRLVDAGFERAYTESVPAEDGARVVVDFSSGSTTRAQYEQEAARAAEVVWLHLEEEVQTVDVAPTSGVPWLDDALPPAVSFVRADLEERFGSRPEELDRPSEQAFEEDAYVDVFGLLFVGAVLLGLFVVAGLVVAVVVLARRAAPPPNPWGAPAYAPTTWEPPPAAPPVSSSPWQPPSS